MRLLALDLATATGWGFYRPGLDAPLSGVWNLSGKNGQRFAQLRDRVGERIEMGVDRIVCEAPFIQKGHENILELLYGLRAQVVELAYRKRVDFVSVPPMQWRPSFIGCTQAPKYVPKPQKRAWLKNRAIEECEKRGWPVRDDNAAEALGILDYERCRIFPDYAALSSPLFSIEAAL